MTTDPLPPDLLRWHCDADTVTALPKTDTDGVPTSAIVGQDRALEAIRLGIDIDSPGYHVFVTGLAGSGRSFTIRSILEQFATRCAVPCDRCYVNNFCSPAEPRLISLRRGDGPRLRREMRELVKAVADAVASLMENDRLRSERDRIASRFQQREQKLFTEFEEKLKKAGLAPVTVQKGPYTISDIFPLVDGKPVPWEQFEQDAGLKEKLGEDELAKRREKAGEFSEELQALVKEGRKVAREMVERVRELEQQMVARVLDGLVGSVRDEFPDNEGVSAYLDEVREHMIEHLDTFKRDEDGPPGRKRREHEPTEAGHPHRVYEVNVVLDAASTDSPPIVVERNPTWSNLFGTVEREMDPTGGPATDFMHVRGGSLLRAEGGYLVMYTRDVLLEPGVWRTLIRSLKAGELEIRSPETLLLAPAAIKPQPVPINLKVILIGDERYYQLLDYYEEDFHKVFKIKAEFASRIDRTDDNLRGFVSAVDQIVTREKLRPMTPGAHAALVEESARRAGRRTKLYMRFGEVADLVREANFFAGRHHRRDIARDDVLEAIRQQRYRHGLIDDRLQEALIEQTLLVATDGERVGQINGLAVYGIGAFHFGKPGRITASVGAGQGGILNIEREARLSGSSHDKGVLILAGYLRNRFGRRRSLALTASLAFEQSYGGVDGDSATVAEFAVLASAISGVPIRQDLAVTGSMNQLGDVQAIGGVNDKVEGFFRLCNERGLTGTQGCIIPVANVEDLMLGPDVVAAAREGRFHLWSVDRVEQALELLTGLPAGEPDDAGQYADDTLYAKMQRELTRLAREAKATQETVRIEQLPEREDAPPSVPGDPPPPGPQS